MKRTILLLITVFLFTANPATSELIRGITIEFVTIGYPGNPGDTRAEANYRGCGAVDHIYRIGKYEVTIGQWNAFVSAAGAPTGNPNTAYDLSDLSPGPDAPASYISWYEAAQFCNYLTSGDKSRGAYQFNGNNTNPGDFLGIDRDSAVSLYGTVYVIPTITEWYKAAYYKPDGSGYSTYANGFNSIPEADNGWNYSGGAYSAPWAVGTGTMEQNGTFDMMGNLWEWNETLIIGSSRGLRGGSYFYSSESVLSSSYSAHDDAGYEIFYTGFRVASLIPEPCTILLLGLGGLLIRRRRI